MCNNPLVQPACAALDGFFAYLQEGINIMLVMGSGIAFVLLIPAICYLFRRSQQ